MKIFRYSFQDMRKQADTWYLKSNHKEWMDEHEKTVFHIFSVTVFVLGFGFYYWLWFVMNI